MDTYNTYQDQHPQQSRFRVVKSMMVESGTYNDQFTRPYTSRLDGDVMEAYNFDTQHGRNVTRGSVAGTAAQILAPSAVVDAHVNISNGWATRRIIFMAEISSGNGMSTVIMGYGDKVDLSIGGLVDPQLRITINSTLSLASMEVGTQHGIITRKRVVDSSHLLGKQTLDSLVSVDPTYQQEERHLYTQRPADIANNLALGHMQAQVAYDARTILVPNRQSMSKRANNSAPTYLAEVITGISQTAMSPDMQGGHISYHEVYNEAAHSLRESGMHQDQVLRAIERNSHINTFGYIEWGNLCSIFPDLDDATTFFTHSQTPTQLTTNHFESVAGNFSTWNVVQYEAIAATTILHTIPSLISQCVLMGLSGTMTNDTIDGVPIVAITDARSFVDNMDRTRSIQQVEHRILTELMPGLTSGNQRLIHVAFNINLVRDAWVAVSYDGQPPVEFSSPCFADGLVLPTISTNEHSLSSLAGNINALVAVSTQ